MYNTFKRKYEGTRKVAECDNTFWRESRKDAGSYNTFKENMKVPEKSQKEIILFEENSEKSQNGIIFFKEEL